MRRNVQIYLIFSSNFKSCQEINQILSYIPYAVPNWFSGTIRATNGHKPLASKEYDIPSVI